MSFTVVIPAFNAAQTLPRAIASVRRQQPDAIVVVDDASTDNTAEIARAAGAHVISFATNKGVSAARNAGFEAAETEWIAFLDADDQWYPQKLAVVANAVAAFPNVEMLAHDFTFSSDDLQANADRKPQLLSVERLLLRNRVQGSCIVLRRTSALRFNDRMRYSEDYELALRAAAERPILFLPQALTLQSDDASSKLSRNTSAMRKGEMQAFVGLCKRKPLYCMLLPFLLAYSVLKHLRRALSP